MSWIATKYAWRTPFKGSVKLLLLALAYTVPRYRTRSEPLSLRQLITMTGLSERQVRNCRDALVKVGEIVVVPERRRKRVRYDLVNLAGPLFAIDGTEQQTAKIAGSALDGSGKDCRIDPAKIAGSDAPTPLCTSTTGTASTTEAEAAARHRGEHKRRERGIQRLGEAHEFLEWWASEFPIHNGGALNTVDLEVDGPRVLELLSRRTMSRLQAMARVLWATKADNDSNSNRSWIAGTDRSIRVLTRKANSLDQQVTTLGLDAPAAPDTWTTISERVRACVEASAYERFIAPCQLFSDCDGVLTILAPTMEDRDAIADHGLEAALAAVVNGVLPGRRLAFVWGRAAAVNA